jgi:hypothetical protein
MFFEKSFVDAISKEINNSKSSTEIETRFGEYNNGKFSPYISKINFEKIQKKLNEIKNIKNTKKDYLQVYYPNHIRHNQTYNNNKITNENWEQKKLIKNIDNNKLNIRISFSIENSIETPEDLEQPIYFRLKETYSYDFNGLVFFDISKIKENENYNAIDESNEKYSIEVELKVLNENSLKILLDNTYFILDILGVKKSIGMNLGADEYRMVKQGYMDLVKTKYFIGMQPIPLSLNKLRDITNEEYALTDKADGYRKLMYVKNKNIYLIGNDMKILKLNATCSIDKECVLDGELINGSIYSAFDIFIYEGKDIRGNNTFGLKTRLSMVQNVIRNTRTSGCDFQCKQFLFGNVIDNAKKIFDYFKNPNAVYKIDGLIYTPVNDPYPVQTKKTWDKLYKWKYEHTIDFLISRQKDCWFLLNKGKDGNVKFEPRHDPFMYKFPLEKLDYPNNSVVEFVYNNNSFHPVKLRDDKTTGNYIGVAYDNFNNALNPVTDLMISNENEYNKYTKGKTEIKKNNSVYKGKTEIKKNNSVYEGETEMNNMRKFHNWIKQDLLERHAKNQNNLLDLACGKGGDIHKWINANINKVLAVDINKNYLQEAEKRKTKVLKYNNIDIDFIQRDMRKDTVNASELFDVINCQFAIHYFFESDKTVNNFFNNVSKNLKENGVFIGTVFDGLRVFNSLVDGDLERKVDNETVFKLKKGYTTEVFEDIKPYGDEIGVFIGGDTILSDDKDDGTPEYIVNYNHLINIAKRYDLEVIESDLFQNIYRDWMIENRGHSLNELEKEISFLNRTFVFRKTSLKDQLLDVDELMNIIHKQEDIMKMKNGEYNESVNVVVNYNDKTVKELKDYCKKLNLKTTGKKSELIERLTKK